MKLVLARIIKNLFAMLLTRKGVRLLAKAVKTFVTDDQGDEAIDAALAVYDGDIDKAIEHGEEFLRLMHEKRDKSK